MVKNVVRSMSWLIVGAAMLAWTAATAPVAAAQDTIKVAFWSPVPLAEFAQFFGAEKLGEFKKHGLRFEFVGAPGSGAATQYVIGGGADIGIGNIDSVMYAVEKGSDVAAFYSYIPENVFTITVYQSRGIRTIGDLKGKKLGVNSLAAGSHYNCRYVLEKNGVPAKDVEFIAVGIDYVTAMKSGRVDGVCSWDSHDYLLHQNLPDALRKDLKTFYNKDTVSLPTNVFVARRSVLKERLTQFVNFIRGYETGVAWVRTNPQEAATEMLKHVSGKGEPTMFADLIKMRVGTAESAWTRKHGAGTFDPVPIRDLAEVYLKWGLVKRALGFEDLVANDVLERLGRR